MPSQQQQGGESEAGLEKAIQASLLELQQRQQDQLDLQAALEASVQHMAQQVPAVQQQVLVID